MPEPRIKPRFFVRRKGLVEDSWTYGDYRQYLHTHRDGSISCVRLSRIPSIAAVVGWAMAVILMPILLIAWHMSLKPIWSNVGWWLVASAILISFALLCIPFPLVVAVGPRQRGNYRRFWEEE